MRNLFAVFVLSLTATTSVVAQTTLPFTFAPGTVAKASEVNANFQALLTAINKLEEKVSKLEGQISKEDVVGTYVLSTFNVRVSSGGTGESPRVEHTATNGTATFSLDMDMNGTFSVSGEANYGLELVFNFQNGPPSTSATAAIQPSTPGPIIGGTWSLSGRTLAITSPSGVSGEFTAAAGGRLFIGVTQGQTQHLLFLVRTN